MSLTIDYRPYFGVPFKRGGRGPAELDCHGLLIRLHAGLGVEVPDIASPETNDEAASLFLGRKSDFLTKWEKSGANDLPPDGAYQPADTLLFRIKGVPCHVGMAINSRQFVHTWEGTRGVVVERISLWEPRLHGIYRHSKLPR